MGRGDAFTGQPTKPQPFRLNKGKREKEDPLMILEVNVAPGRVGTIGIHRGDNAHALARNFAKTYRLNREAEETLVELIEE